MKAHTKRIRAVRALAIAGCVAGLAGPSAAMAMPQPNGPVSGPVTYHPHGRPAPDEVGARLDHRGIATSDFSASAPSRYVLPSGFKTDAQSGAPRQSPSPAPTSVVREIKTVVHDGGRTLAIVLASSALGIALLGSGYGAFRFARLQRRAMTS